MCDGVLLNPACLTSRNDGIARSAQKTCQLLQHQAALAKNLGELRRKNPDTIFDALKRVCVLHAQARR